MSTRQIELSAERLRKVSQREGELFWQMQVEASELLKRAVAMRKGAWAIYHGHFKRRDAVK